MVFKIFGLIPRPYHCPVLPIEWEIGSSTPHPTSQCLSQLWLGFSRVNLVSIRLASIYSCTEWCCDLAYLTIPCVSS